MIRRLALATAVPALLAAAASWLVAAETASGTVRVRVTESGSGRPLPCRLTVLDREGRLVPLEPVRAPGLAYRPGVLYTASGEVAFSLPVGKYTLHATRGLEYGLATRAMEVRSGTRRVDLRLEREVDTAGYISSDTHIHTLTHSGHGDSSIEERMATIAGEGIELAVATDHNHHTDYAPVAQASGAERHFTPVIGNEVTTSAGHFNIFPVRPGSPVPDHRVTDWKALLARMRAVPGVRVVILNHPSDNHGGFTPTDPRRFHPASGESHDGRDWDFDGIEVVTSAALQSDWMKPYRDWFALLNSGRRTVGIGSSDTHDVNRFILGQARTYIASRATEPDGIDVTEACDNIRAGRVLVSMGLLTEAWVDDHYGPGDLATGKVPEMRVRVRVQGPRWIHADRLELYANGQKIVTRNLVHPADAVVKADLTLTLPRPARDAWLVAIASGPGVDQAYWPIGRPYQPTRPDWEPRVIGSTSPIRVDGDGNGRFSSPRDYARAVVTTAGGVPERVMEALRPHDTAVAVQAAALCRERGMDLAAPPVRRAIDAAAPHVRHGFVAYRNLLPQ